LQSNVVTLEAEVDKLNQKIKDFEINLENERNEKASIMQEYQACQRREKESDSDKNKYAQAAAKLERQFNDANNVIEEKRKENDMATMKMNELERQKRKIQRECVALENDKTRVTSEKNDALAEKESAKGYMNNLFRDFNWLKKKTDEEQAGIMKLERDRNMLKTQLIKMEKNNEENRNTLLRKEQIIATL